MSLTHHVSPLSLLRQIVVVAAGLLLLSACGKEPTVEQQIIASLEIMEKDAEDGRPFDFMSHVAESFKGRQGMLNRTDFQRFMLLQMNENRRMTATFFPIQVAYNPEIANEANANFRLLVTGGEGLLPERGQLFEVQTGWIREDGEWLLLSADWETAQFSE